MNNFNSNNFIMGVDPEKNKNEKPSNVLINHIKNIEKNAKENVKNYKSFNLLKNELIDKLESDVYMLNNKIKNFNLEKKSIIELDNKEIERLKEIIRHLYTFILTINKSIELKQGNRVGLLEEIRKGLNSNSGLKKNIDEIMLGQQKLNKNLVVSKKNNSNLSILNIIEAKSNKNNNTGNESVTQNVNESVTKLNNFYKNLKNNIDKQIFKQNMKPNNLKNTTILEQVQQNNNSMQNVETETKVSENNYTNMESFQSSNNMESVVSNNNRSNVESIVFNNTRNNRNMRNQNANINIRNQNRNVTTNVNLNRNIKININRRNTESPLSENNGNMENIERTPQKKNSNNSRKIPNKIRNTIVTNQEAKNALNKYFL